MAKKPKTTDRETIAKRLRAARDKSKYTQAEIAKRAGIDQQQVARYETGGRVPTIEAAQKLAKAIGCPLAEIIGE